MLTIKSSFSKNLLKIIKFIVIVNKNQSVNFMVPNALKILFGMTHEQNQILI